MFSEDRIILIERLLKKLARQVNDLGVRVAALEQQPWQISQGNQGGGGGAGGAFFCLPTSLAGATGSWPSLTPGSQSLTVYQASAGVLTSLGTATVYNFFPAAAVASKVLEITPDGAGNYTAVSQSCI